MIQWWCIVAVLSAGIAAADPAEPRYSLADCLDLALRQNPDMLVARQKLEETAGAIVEARAGFLPRLTSGASYELVQRDLATLGGTSPDRRNELWSVTIRLTEPVYAGGAIRGRMAIARLRQEARMLEYQVTTDRVMTEVRIAFYDVVRRAANISVRQEAVKFLEQQLKKERQKLDVGAGERLLVLRAQVSLALEQAALIEAENEWRNARVRLSELLAVPCSNTSGEVPFEVTGELTYRPIALDVTNCVARALESRAELKIRDRETAIEKKQLTVDRSALLPHVDLFAGYDVVSEPDPAAVHDWYSGYVAGVAVSWQIFDGRATRGKMQATHARLAQAEVTRDATARTVNAEVVVAFHDLEEAEKTIQSQAKNVDLARETLQLATQNFELGTATQLDVLQARLDLTRAQTTELTARYAHNVALARLQRAISSEFVIVDDRKP